MPLRAAQLPTGPYLQLYRRLRFGDLLSVQRARHAAVPVASRAGRLRARRSGSTATARPRSIRRGRSRAQAQQAWLLDGLGRRRADWNVLANQVPFAPNDTNADPAIRTFGGEKWDGYPVRSPADPRLPQAAQLGNTIVITGDVHQNFVRNVPPDYVQLDAEPVATEFIGTSISTRRRSHVEHGVRRQRQQSAPALRGQPSRLRPLHGHAAISGEPTTGWCRASSNPTMAASARSRRSSSNRDRQVRSAGMTDRGGVDRAGARDAPPQQSSLIPGTHLLARFWREAVGGGRLRIHGRARRLRGSASSRSSRHAVHGSPRSATRPPARRRQGFGEVSPELA